MQHGFDQGYWDAHWEAAGAHDGLPPNPYLVREVSGLSPGSALEAGCGEGAEAIWLGSAGWTVTAVDIADEPLARARESAAARGSGDAIRWVRADLSTWEPPGSFDLVTTHYAHPAMPQLEFYDRLSRWVALGGSLLVVGHLHGHGHGPGPPAEASATAGRITVRLDPDAWDVVTAEECSRTVETATGGQVTLHDVIVRAVRRKG